MDLHTLRLDQPHPRARQRNPGHRRVRHLPYASRARAGRPPGALAGAAAGEESGMSDRARAQVTTPDALPDERVTDAALRPSRLDEFVGPAEMEEYPQNAIDEAKQRLETLDTTPVFLP